MPQPVPGGKPAQRGGQEPGGEGVPGADGRDDVDPEGGNAGDGVRAGPAVADTAGLATADTAGLATAVAAALVATVAATVAAALVAALVAALEQRRAPAPCFTTSARGSGRAARIASGPPVTPQASSASSSPTKTRSLRRASSSRTVRPVSGWGQRWARWLTSNETSGREGRGAVSSRSRVRQSAESAAVMPERCRTRPESSSARGVLSGDIAEAAEPAR